jgi:hypothetical protein
MRQSSVDEFPHQREDLALTTRFNSLDTGHHHTMAMTIGRRMATRAMARVAQQPRSVASRMKSSQAMAMDDDSYMAPPGPVTILTEEETMFKDTGTWSKLRKALMETVC